MLEMFISHGLIIMILQHMFYDSCQNIFKSYSSTESKDHLKLASAMDAIFEN